MRFFDRQRVDQVGATSVVLQKVLLFLMIVNAFSLFYGGFLGFILCLIGFIGAVSRRTGLLASYFFVSVGLMVAGFVFSVYTMFYFPYYYNNYYGSDSASGYTSEGMSSSSESSSSSSESLSSSSESMSSTSYYDSSMYTSSRMYLALYFLLLVACFIVFYLKMYSLVLTWRLRKMILATKTVLPVVSEHTEEEHDNSCAVQEEQPAPQHVAPTPVHHNGQAFFQPGFMPYSPMPMPNMQQYPGAPAMVPPPMMYGQYPVYYSFAPIPQAPAQSEEKL